MNGNFCTSTLSVSSGLPSSHCHTTTTSHPNCLSSAMFFLSRSTFLQNLSFQNLALVFGVPLFRHPSCWCQKQPWMNIAVLCFGNTMSGDPGRSLRCNLNLSPIRWAADRTSSSGFVFFEPTARMICERLVLLTWSLIQSSIKWRRIGRTSFLISNAVENPIVLKGQCSAELRSALCFLNFSALCLI